MERGIITLIYIHQSSIIQSYKRPTDKLLIYNGRKIYVEKMEELLVTIAVTHDDDYCDKMPEMRGCVL